MTKPTIYIIGAGISGLTAALLLLEKGYKVKVYEATKHAGGRLRSFYDEKLAVTIDNGNHLILQANESAMDLIDRLGVQDRFNKFPGKFSFYDVADKSGFETDNFNLSSIPGIGFADYLKLLKILLPLDKTVAEVFSSEGALFKNFINHISRSMLNTDSQTASAKLLRNCLIKALITKSGLEHYFPKNNWNESLIQPLLDRISAKGGEVLYNKSVKRITPLNRGFEIIFSDNSIHVQPEDSIIAATPSWVTANLIENIKVPKKFNAIINIHFKLDHELKPQLFALLNSSIEWVFIKPGIISTTVSDANESLLKTSDEQLAEQAWADIAEYLKLQTQKAPPYRVITEKRATFSADNENLNLRPANKTKYQNLYLSGDYTELHLPATIESAIQSAEKTVKLIESSATQYFITA